MPVVIGHPRSVSFSTKRFLWHGKTSTFTAEASELPELTSGVSVIFLVSQWTGKEMEFRFAGVRRDREGETLSWEFKALNGMGLTVFND